MQQNGSDVIGRMNELIVIAGRPGMGAGRIAKVLIERSGLTEFLLFDLSDGGPHIVTADEVATYRALQREKGVPVILLSNLSRRTEEEVSGSIGEDEAVPASTRPRKSDLPLAVYDVADLVLLVYRASYYRVTYVDKKKTDFEVIGFPSQGEKFVLTNLSV